jgi:hypothetical protein
LKIRRARLAAPLTAALILAFGGAEAAATDSWKSFLAGAAVGFGVHETSHLAFDVAFDAEPRIKGVRFGPIPFFAITHRNGLPARQEAWISGAGFLSQHAVTEVILSRRAPGQTLSAFGKGALAFHVATSIAYAGAALSKYGPYERDTRGLATATRTDERWVGALVLAPAAFDVWRGLRPDSAAAKWLSRLSKIGYVSFIAFKH